MLKNRIALVHFSPLHSWSHQKAAKLNWWGTWCNFLQHLLMRSVWCSPMWRLPAKKRSRSLLTSVMNFSTPVTSVMILGATVQWTKAVSLSPHGNGQGYMRLFPVTFVSGCGKCVTRPTPLMQYFWDLTGSTCDAFLDGPLCNFLDQSLKNIH